MFYPYYFSVSRFRGIQIHITLINAALGDNKMISSAVSRLSVNLIKGE